MLFRKYILTFVESNQLFFKSDFYRPPPFMLAIKRNNLVCVELLLVDPRVDLLARDNKYKRSKKEVCGREENPSVTSFDGRRLF